MMQIFTYPIQLTVDPQGRLYQVVEKDTGHGMMRIIDESDLTLSNRDQPKRSQPMTAHATLYEQDFQNWVLTQVDLLRQGKTQDLDLEHLIAELDDMGKSSLRELESRFIILIAHLLKWQFQLDTLTGQWKDFEGKSWRKTIIEQRTQLNFLLDKVPSLKSSLALAREEAYPVARHLAIKETGMSPDSFPGICPYAVSELLDEDFYPGNTQ